MTLEEIKELIQAVIDSGVAEIEVQRGDNRVLIRRNSRTPVSHEAALPSAAASVSQSSLPHTAPGATSNSAAAPTGAPVDDPASDPSLVLVKSPIVGTFYESPSPGAPPFIRIGETVQPGRVLCIIESMKLMNEIEAELSGIVVSRLVENGHPVEYGEALFSIRPS